MKKNFYIYLLSIILLLVSVKLFIKPEDINVLKNISLLGISISIFIALFIYVLSGFQFYYILLKQNNIKLSLFDIFTLPISMSLWGFIIPFQGSLLYTLFFLKKKYNVKLNSGLTINLYSYLISIFLTGLIGIYFSFNKGSIYSPLFFISLIFFFLPFSLFLLKIILNITTFKKNIFINNKFTVFLALQTNNLIKLFKNKKLTIIIFFINILHISISCIWYLWIIKTLGFNISLITVLILTMILRLSIIIRLTPGNIGLEELISGSVLLFIGSQATQGVTLTIFTRIITIILMITIGLLATIYNLRYFKIKKNKSLLHLLQQKSI